MSRKHDPVAWIATGLGAGKLPLAPGTWGSAQAVLLVALVEISFSHQARFLLALLLALIIGLGIWTAGSIAVRSGESDPSEVVIDEIAGQILTLLAAPATPLAWLSGFLLFRLFDILKPFPIRQSERLPRGWGIVLDDLIAGVYAALSLYAASAQGWI